ncbi:IS110 family transposase [Mesorhizobium sp. M0700]|uniref:transposase n=1 Tax=Mesorhizobium sp. M0700 TaxID=2956988 RepID=UPI00333A9883
MTITGVNVTVALSIVAAIGDVERFSSPEKLVSYFGLNPRVRQYHQTRPSPRAIDAGRGGVGHFRCAWPAAGLLHAHPRQAG